MRSRRCVLAAIIVIIFIAVDHLQEVLSLTDFYRRLYERFPFYVPEGGKSLLQIVLCVAALRLFWARSAAEAMRELGAFGRLSRGLAFGIGTAAPMFVGFALTAPPAVPPAWLATAYLAGLAPLAEEVLYRGFACGLLHSRAGMPAWAALGLQATVFGWGHVEQGGSLREALGLFLLLGSGGLLYGWFFLRWGRNIWVPFALHACMNLSWEVFQVGQTALGGWYAFTLQSTTMVLGIVFTLRWTTRIQRSTPGPVDADWAAGAQQQVTADGASRRR